jgi:hypothetical protein
MVRLHPAKRGNLDTRTAHPIVAIWSAHPSLVAKPRDFRRLLHPFRREGLSHHTN